MFKVYSPKDEHIIYRALKLGVEKILWNLGFHRNGRWNPHLDDIKDAIFTSKKSPFNPQENRPFGFPSLRNCICHKTSPSENQAAALAEAAGRAQQDETSVMSSKSLWFRSNFAYRKIVSVVFFANVSWFFVLRLWGVAFNGFSGSHLGNFVKLFKLLLFVSLTKPD